MLILCAKFLSKNLFVHLVCFLFFLSIFTDFSFGFEFSLYFVFEFDFPPIFNKKNYGCFFSNLILTKFIFSLTVMKYRAKPKNITIISKMTWWSCVWGKRGNSEWTRESWNYLMAATLPNDLARYVMEDNEAFQKEIVGFTGGGTDFGPCPHSSKFIWMSALVGWTFWQSEANGFWGLYNNDSW